MRNYDKIMSESFLVPVMSAFFQDSAECNNLVTFGSIIDINSLPQFSDSNYLKGINNKEKYYKDFSKFEDDDDSKNFILSLINYGKISGEEAICRFHLVT